MGRPLRATPPTPGERVPLSLRVTADIRTRLEEAALESGRSLSQEAEMRLERSIRAVEHGGDERPEVRPARLGDAKS